MNTSLREKTEPDGVNDKLLVETAVEAGEIMLVSGAEIYRVEDTVGRILSLAPGRKSENVALGTSLIVTLDRPGDESLTIMRRIRNRSTNLNRVCQVNEVSRRLCAGEMSFKEAQKSLREIKQGIQYHSRTRAVGYIGVSAFFALLLGGTWREGLGAGLSGVLLAAVCLLNAKARLNDFCINALGAFAVGVTALAIETWVMPSMNGNAVITGAIMPLVPGVTFTTSIRDILNGDYASGTNRMMEALVVALSVAVGIGTAMSMFSNLTGG